MSCFRPTPIFGSAPTAGTRCGGGRNRRRTCPRWPRPPSKVPPPATALPAVPGYEVLGELGRGGMAVVYQARQAPAQPHRGPEDDPAPASTPAPPSWLRFLSETEAVARLQHPQHRPGVRGGRGAKGCRTSRWSSAPAARSPGVADAAPLAPREAAALMEKLARAMDSGAPARGSSTGT